MLKKLQDNLAGVAALIGVVVAIGGGFTVYGQLSEKINNLEGINLDPLLKEVASQNVKIATIEEKLNTLGEEHGHTQILINKKEIELMKNTIEEIKTKSSNPLAN